MGKKMQVYLFVAAISLNGVARLLAREYRLISPAMLTLVSFLTIAAAALALFKLINNFKLENTYIRFMIIIFLVYQLITIGRGFTLDFVEVKGFIQSEYLFWPFVIPIFIFFDKDLVTFAHFFKAIYVVAIFGILLSLAQPKLISQKSTAEMVMHAYAFACGFILLNAYYLPKKMRIVAFIALAIGIGAFIFLARRNGIVSYSALIMAAVALNMRNTPASKTMRIFPIAGIIVMAAILSLGYLPKSFTAKIEDRLTEDSRSTVFDDFFEGMKDDEIFGKGMNGKYYSPTGGSGLTDEGELKDSVDFRDVIENGYLQQYLNGGIVYIVLFGLVMLPAVYFGLFKSNNQFTKASAVIILLWLIDMGIFGLPRLTMEYLLVWICAGICYTKTLRDKTDDEVADTFLNYEEYENSMVY